MQWIFEAGCGCSGYLRDAGCGCSELFSEAKCGYLIIVGCGYVSVRQGVDVCVSWVYRILTFHSIYDYFALLKAFNTNTLNYHQYFKDKLSSHQPSHMHNTRHRTNSNFNTPLFNQSKT